MTKAAKSKKAKAKANLSGKPAKVTKAATPAKAKATAETAMVEAAKQHMRARQLRVFGWCRESPLSFPKI